MSDVAVLLALLFSCCLLYNSGVFHSTPGGVSIGELTRIAGTPDHSRRHLLSSIPSGLIDDMQDNDLEFACFNAGSSCPLPSTRYLDVCFPLRGSSYCVAQAVSTTNESWKIYKSSDSTVVVESYTSDRTCAGTPTTYTLTEGVCQTTSTTWGTGENAQEFVGFTKKKPWVQGTTSISSKYTAARWDDSAQCSGDVINYFMVNVFDCGDTVDGAVTPQKRTVDSDGMHLSTYTSTACDTLSTSVVYPSFECDLRSGEESHFFIVGDSAMGATLATTVTALAASAIGGAVATSVATSVAGGVVGGGAGGGAAGSGAAGSAGSSPAGPIVELIHVMQLLSVMQSMGFVSNGGVRGMTENLAWANLYFEPPFSVDSELVGSARRLMANSNLANPSSDGTSSQFVGNLFWFIVIFIALIMTHTVVILTMWVAQKIIAAVKKRPAAPLPGWVRFPKWEFIYLITAFPGLALSSAQAIRSFDLRVSFVAILVLLVLPLLPIVLFVVIWRGTRLGGGLVVYKKIANKSAILKPGKVFSAVKASIEAKMFCLDGAWSQFYELAPMYGEWTALTEQGVQWLETWDFAVADWSSIARFHVPFDLFLKWLRAVVLGMIVGFPGASYVTWFFVFCQTLGEYASGLAVRMKNQRESQRLGSAAGFFIAAMFGSSVFLTTNSGFSLSLVDTAKLDLVVMSFAFVAAMCKIAEVALAPLGLAWSIVSFIASSVWAVIKSSRTAKRQVSEGDSNAAEDTLEKGENMVEDGSRMSKHADQPPATTTLAVIDDYFEPGSAYLPCTHGCADRGVTPVASGCCIPSRSIEMADLNHEADDMDRRGL